MKTTYLNTKTENKSLNPYFTNTANDLQKKIAAIWKKVDLLQEVKYIENEKDRFSVAYRFMEIELEKTYRKK